MDLAGLNLYDILGTLVGLILTLCVFSYAFADNALFRLAIHIFIGVSAGYAFIVVLYNIIWPQLIAPLLAGASQDWLLAFILLVLGALLLAKTFPPLSGLGSPVMAYLVGVGAAAAIGGAVMGTIFPQVNASIYLLDLPTIAQGETNLAFGLLNGGIILVGTLTTLIYFYFGARPLSASSPFSPWIKGISWVGQVFIAVTFGVIFAGVYAAALAALEERVGILMTILLSFISPGS